MIEKLLNPGVPRTMALLMMMLVAYAQPMGARDFEYAWKGVSLRYTVLDEDTKTVAVAQNTDVSGALIIPPKVTDGTDIYSVVSIGEKAFWDSSLTSVTIPESVTSIGVDAFSCMELEKAEFASLESLCKIKFYGRYSNPLYVVHNLYINGEEITEVIIPDGITSLDYTFSGCSGLTSVTIPESVTSIGIDVFSGCSGLTSVTIPENATSISEGIFYNCSQLTSVTIPKNVHEIGGYAFSGCSKLTSVTIPESVTWIGRSAFSGCSKLTSVTIPKDVHAIGQSAFSSCSNLTSVYYEAENLISAPSNVFSSGTYEKATLFLNENAVFFAGAVDPWKNFVNIEAYTFSGIEGIATDGNNAAAEYYDLNGVHVNSDALTPGLYIKHQGNKSEKILVK